MAELLHEIIRTQRALGAGVEGPFDLGVHPTSFLVVRFQADAGAAAPDLAQLLAHITNVTIRFKGTSILSLSAADLWRFVHVMWGKRPTIENFNAVAPGLVRWYMIVPFARMPYILTEGFPGTRRGEFTFEMTRSAALTNITNLEYSVEQVQVLDMQPTRFTKLTTQERAIAAGDLDQELPIGNPFFGILLFSPTTFGNVPETATIEDVRLLLDNVEFAYSSTTFEVLRALMSLRLSDAESFVGLSSNLRDYAYMDFDPLRDDQYLVPTEGRASVKLRYTSTVAGTVRAITGELVSLGAPG